jgi:hypothetical protein
MQGTLVVGSPWSNRPKIEMARVAGSTLFLVDKRQELCDKAEEIWCEAKIALETVTRETSAEDCFSAWVEESKAAGDVFKAEAVCDKFREELPALAEAAAKKARDEFAEKLTPILEAKRAEVIAQYGDRIPGHVKFTFEFPVEPAKMAAAVAAS